jgi:hypothetical protein
MERGSGEMSGQVKQPQGLIDPSQELDVLNLYWKGLMSEYS